MILALEPIALGHALAIGVVVLTVGLLGMLIPVEVLLVLSGGLLPGFAAYTWITRFRHPRWVSMRVSTPKLVLWLFLTATAHGAGLMLIPVMLQLRGESVSNVAAEGHHAHHAPAASEPLNVAIATVGVHTLALVATASLLAVLVVIGNRKPENLRFTVPTLLPPDIATK